MRISTNVQSLVAQHSLEKIVNRHSTANTQLASGNRLVKTAIDPAGVAISSTLNAKIRSQYRSERNANDGISLMQVADGVLGVLHGITGRLKELAMQSSTDGIGDTERVMVDREFQQMINEMKRISSSAKYNGNHILNDQGSVYEIQVGTNNKKSEDRIFYDMDKMLGSLQKFGIGSMNVRTKQASRNCFSNIDGLSNHISAGRANLGSVSKRMESVVSNIQNSRENNEASKSKIKDSDVAKVAAESASLQIQKDATTAMLAHANSAPKHVLKLIE